MLSGFGKSLPPGNLMHSRFRGNAGYGAALRLKRNHPASCSLRGSAQVERNWLPHALDLQELLHPLVGCVNAIDVPLRVRVDLVRSLESPPARQ